MIDAGPSQTHLTKLSPFTLWTPGAAILGALLGSALTAWLGYVGRTQELDIRMVEVGIGILRAPPTDDIASIREWAMDVIAKKSGFPFTPEQRAALLKEQLQYRDAYSYNTGSYVSAPDTSPNRPPPTSK
jgi:hypothetical protein